MKKEMTDAEKTSKADDLIGKSMSMIHRYLLRAESVDDGLEDIEAAAGALNEAAQLIRSAR